jgi:2-oxoglutarate ferredoxin oxidoreductase subunit beta
MMEMPDLVPRCLLRSSEEPYTLDDYESEVPRWCTGCGDLAILAAIQRLCRDEQLPLEKIVCVSGIGCSSRFPHYMHTYGFHGTHGRALPIAEGVKMKRPDLHVFVNTGDGDCCSIGAAHWIHAIRYNMDMTCVLHDNQVYGLTKNQISPTAPKGFKSNTTPRGSYVEGLNPLSTTLGVANVSFAAQTVDWVPSILYDIISQAFHHRGFAFIRVLQRCPEFLPDYFEPWVEDPERLLLLTHENGIKATPDLTRIYRQHEAHDPSDLNRARELASLTDPIPVGIFYRNPEVPRYEDVINPPGLFTPDVIRKSVEEELDRFTVWPTQ